MDKNRTIFNARQALAARLKGASDGTMYATIASVDANKRTCSVTVDGAEFTDVLLYAIEDSELKGVVLMPKVDSTVLVSRIGGSNELYVAMFSEVDKVLLTLGDDVMAAIDDKELIYENKNVKLKITGDKVELNADKIEINGGENRGLVKIEQLTAKVNAFVDAFNNHVHSGVIIAVSGGSGAPAVGAPGNSAPPTAIAQQLNKSDYENTKVVH